MSRHTPIDLTGEDDDIVTTQMESKTAFPPGFVDHNPHGVRDTPSAFRAAGAASFSAYLGGLPSIGLSTGSSSMLNIQSTYGNPTYHSGGLGAGPFDSRNEPGPMPGIDGLPRGEVLKHFGQPRPHQGAVVSAHQYGQVRGATSNPWAGTMQPYHPRMTGSEGSNQLGHQPTAHTGRVSQPGFSQSLFRPILPAGAVIARNPSGTAVQAPAVRTYGSTTGCLDGAEYIDAVVNELSQPNRRILQLPAGDFELDLGSAVEAEAKWNSRTKVNIADDDIVVVEPNPEPYVRLIMRAMTSTEFLGPDEQGLDAVQTKHWDKWQKSALDDVREVLSLPFIQRKVEMHAWMLINDAIVAHKNGFPASAMRPMGDHRKLKISARIKKVAQLIKDFPIIRHDVLTDCDAIIQLVSMPHACSARKNANRRGNCKKEEQTKKAKAALKKTEARRAAAAANGEEISDEGEQVNAEGSGPEEDGAETNTRVVQPTFTYAAYMQNFSFEQRKQITKGLKRKAAMDQQPDTDQEQIQNSPATNSRSPHHTDTASSTPNVD